MNAGFFPQQFRPNGKQISPSFRTQHSGSASVSQDRLRDRLAVKTRTQSAPMMRQQATEAARSRNYTRAIELLCQAIALDGGSAIDYNNRGLMYFYSGDIESAIADYNWAIELNPQLAQAYNNRGNSYAAQGLLVEAMLDYEMAIDLNPFNVRALINQGITLRDLEIYPLALENFDIALGMGQLEGHIYAERGRTYHVMGEWNAAIADYRRALQLLDEGTADECNDPATRLRSRVENWQEQLLSPSQGELDG